MYCRDALCVSGTLAFSARGNALHCFRCADDSSQQTRRQERGRMPGESRLMNGKHSGNVHNAADRCCWWSASQRRNCGCGHHRATTWWQLYEIAILSPRHDRLPTPAPLVCTGREPTLHGAVPNSQHQSISTRNGRLQQAASRAPGYPPD